MQQTLLCNVFETAPLPTSRLRYQMARMCQNIVALFDHVGEGTFLRANRNEKWNTQCQRYGVEDLSGGIGAFNLGVFAVPDTRFVLKVVASSDVFINAADWMMRNPECELFPRVAGMVRLSHDMVGVIVERCVPIDWRGGTSREQITLIGLSLELRETIKETSMIVDVDSPCYWDLHRGNIMYAPDGRMVCVDPIAD